MDGKKLLEIANSIHNIDTSNLANIAEEVRATYLILKEDFHTLGNCLYHMANNIMKMTDIKPEHVSLYQQFIDDIIICSIQNQFQVGFDGMKMIFNSGAQFYKKADLDIGLKFPLGRNRPLEKYIPSVGEECDVVRPYITSTSYCGWVRCILLEIQGGKYTLQYSNTSTPATVREQPFFAPLGTRTADFDWRMNLDIGSPIQAQLNRVWYQSTIVQAKSENGCKRVLVSFRRFNEQGDRTDSQGNHYFGLGPNEDEWMDILSPRIQCNGKMANKKLCYYTSTSEQILPDDNYDIIFEKQYKQKPFHAIMRNIFCRSLSFVRFMNTFTENRGFETYFQILENPNINIDAVFHMQYNIGCMVALIPRMDINRYLPAVYEKTYAYFKNNAKILNNFRIDQAYLCIDMIGRRILSLTQVYRDQNQLRKYFIVIFMKMNMEKQMLALRYLYDIINPKKPYSTQERASIDNFIVQEKIFEQIYQIQTHQQILSRTAMFLKYLIERKIVQQEQIQYLWSMAPQSDQRGRAVIQKLFAELSKMLPIEYVYSLLDKILSLKETDLTFDNLNLLRQLKNREITSDYQLKILAFLWDIITTKSFNIKTNIEEEVQKVFKVFVSGIKQPQTRMNVLESMVARLTETKKIRSEIDLLKDFIVSYPQKIVMEVESTDAPLTIYDAINFLKSRNIYEKLLELLVNVKKDQVIAELLRFLGFLFEYDFEDASHIIKPIYDKLGPSDILLEWIQKNIKRAYNFVNQMLQSYDKLQKYANLTNPGFEALRDIILEINEKDKKLKIMTTYKYTGASDNSNGTKNVQAQTTSIKPPEAKPETQKIIGPVLPQKKKHLYILVSPFQLKGMKFLSNLLHYIKNSRVYDEAVKLIIQFIVRLDQSIENKTEQYRREFLGQIIQQIDNLVKDNQITDEIKQKMQVYINLFIQIFAETEKYGIGNLSPHFEKLKGQKMQFNVENNFPQAKEKKIDKFIIIMNENDTIWRFKVKIAEIIGQAATDIDVIKFVNPVDDGFNGKSLVDLFFYDGQGIKISKKPIKDIPRHNLLNEDGTDLSERFFQIVNIWFNDYKNSEGVIGIQELTKLADAKWKGSLFRQQDKLQKIMSEFDQTKKGYLLFSQFKNFFYMKSVKNEHAIWKIISMSGYKNNLRITSNEFKELDINTLPRKILSSPSVYQLIFKIFKNPTFKDVHLNFYRLLSQLEVDESLKSHIEGNIYTIIQGSDSIYEFCYALEVTNSSIAEKGEFCLEFWRKKGCEIIIERLKQFANAEQSIYKLQIQIKNTVLPNMIKTLNFYQKYLLCDSKIVRFLSTLKLNTLQIEEVVKKLKQYNKQEQNQSDNQQKKQMKNKLLQLQNQFNNKQAYDVIIYILHNLIKNFTTDSTDFIPRLTVETVRLVGYLSLGGAEQLFNPLQLFYGSKSQSLNYRRSSCNIIYLYTQQNQCNSEDLLLKLLEEMPQQGKHIFSNYFSLLSKTVELYVEKHIKTTEKDQFFIQLAHNMLNKLFQNIRGEARTALIGDKVIVGVLSTIQILIQKDVVCSSLANRKHEITEKCLFAVGIDTKLEELQVTPEMLSEQKQAQHFKNYVMCKTEETRDITYRIVEKLHNATAGEDLDYIEKYIFPIFKNLGEEVRLTDSKSLSVGLKNFGSTCYMNSMLQVLNAVQPFRNYIMHAKGDSELIKQLQNTFASLYFSERIDYAPRKVLEAFVPPINPGIQQDTTQFLNLLFDQVESGLSLSEYRKLLDEVFKGAQLAQMICTLCGAKKQNRQEFFSCSIQIDGKYDLNTALQGAYQGQIISDYFCESCQKKGDMKKRNILSDIPNIFFIHLRRIVFNYDMFMNMKIHTRLQFPNELNIEPYTKEGVELRQSLGLEYLKNLTHNQQETKKFEQMTMHDRQKDYYKLKLKGVIVHSGSADVGHYYSILSSGNTWHKFDDSRISIFTMSGFENQCYGGTWTNEQWGGFGSSVNAYFLVYEKVVKHPITLYKHIDQQSQKIQEQVKVKYQQTKVYNTIEHYKSVWLDNHKFMVQTHLLQESYAKGFMKFMCGLLKQDTKSNKIELISELLYKVTYYSQEVGNLAQIPMKTDNDVSSEIFYKYIIGQKKKTFKLLFSYNKKVRNFMACFMSVILISVFTNPNEQNKNKEKDKSQVLDFIIEYLNNMTGEVAKNWLRIDGFFEMLTYLVISSSKVPQLWNFFNKFSLISTLIDFVLEKSSPVKISQKSYSLGTKTNPVSFYAPLQLIAYLIKNSYGLTGKNYEVPPPAETNLFHLSDNDVICLSYSQFYRKMFRERQNLKTLAVIVQRLCIKNLPFSRMISEIILETVGSITDMGDQMQDLSDLILEVLKIKDEYWQNRAEMILGVSSPYVLQKNIMTTLDQERYIFSSTIYDIFPVESIFSYVYLYRLKNSLACFYLVKSFIEGCSVSEEATAYLIKQPAPSYYYRDYLHWIEQFITSFLGFLTIPEKTRERVQIDIDQVLKNLEDYKKFKEQFGDKIDLYKTVITGEILEKTQVLSIEKDDVQVNIREYEVYCLNSEPANSTNKSLELLLDNGRISKPISDQSTILNFMKNPKKGIALKMQPVQESEDKDLIGLFEETYVATQTVPQEVIQQPTQINKVDDSKMEEENVEVKKQNQKDEEKDEEKDKKIEEPLQVINIEGFSTVSYYRQIEIINKSKTSKIVRMQFSKQIDQSNTILPLQMTYKLSVKSNQSQWVSKQDHLKPWTPITFKIFVEEFSKQKHDKTITRINWFKLYGYQENNNVDNQEEKQVSEPIIDEKDQKNENEQIEKPKDAAADETENNNISDISCPICTYINLSINSSCEMCGSNLN